MPYRLAIERALVWSENPSRPHGTGPIHLANFAPFPKNPVIGAFFREIHRADELGSGMRKLMRYGKHYGGSDPRLIEGDVFRMEIAVPAGKTSGKGSEKGSEKSSEKIIQLLRAEPEKSAAELAEVIGISSRAVEKQIAKLRDEGRLRRIGPDKGGHWEVLN